MTGYSLLRYTRFNIFNIHSYLAVFIRLFDNLYNKINGTPYCKYTHSAMLIEEEGDIYVYEAVSEGYKRANKFVDYIDIYGIDNFLLVVPNFEYDVEIIRVITHSLVGDKYDVEGLGAEMVYLSTDERLWIGKNKNLYKVFCTNATGFIWYKGSGGKVFRDYARLNPYDIYNSTNLTCVPLSEVLSLSKTLTYKV